MPEYLPLYKPGAPRTLTASTTVTAGQLCVQTGVGTTGPAAGASAAVLGVAAFDAATGETVTLYRGGVQRLTASGAITAGALLVSAAGGAVAANATPSAGQKLGIALTTAANGQPVEAAMKR